MSRDPILDQQHIFHKECLVDWLKSQGRCPICNLSVHTNILIKNADKKTNLQFSDHAGKLLSQFETIKHHTEKKSSMTSKSYKKGNSQYLVTDDFQVRHIFDTQASIDKSHELSPSREHALSHEQNNSFTRKGTANPRYTFGDQ